MDSPCQVNLRAGWMNCWMDLSTRSTRRAWRRTASLLPKDEYSLKNVFKKEANIFAEYTGLYGFVAKSAYQGLFPDTNSLGKEVDYQGSRQLDNFSRRYYDKELGAGVGPHPAGCRKSLLPF